MTTGDPASTAQRAERLVRLYPRSWRDRYGDEFAELLESDIAEHPRSWRRVADVFRGAGVARIGAIGLTGPLLEPGEQIRVSLAILVWCVAVALAFGATMWSQFAVAWQSAAPARTATDTAIAAISVAIAAFLAIAVAAAAPIIWAVARRLIADRSKNLLLPTTLVVGGAATLLAGASHLAKRWPGAGSHHAALAHGAIPSSLPSLAWASTLSVSSYWAHPSTLVAVPATELVWMVASPLAFTCLVFGSAKAIRGACLSPRMLKFEATMARLACTTMAVLVTGTAIWILDGVRGPDDLYRFGNLDLFGAVAMTAALAVALRTTRRAHLGLAAIGTARSWRAT